jgi:hypothetical protein
VGARLVKLCREAEATAATLPISDAARRYLAGAAAVLSPGVVGGAMAEPAAQRAQA